nr:predicted GPI-anchored protein 58 [Aegilops tauschii subsp. strangulata]
MTSFSSSPPSLLHAANPRPSSALSSPALPQHALRSNAPASALPFPFALADPSPFARCCPSPQSVGPHPRALTATAALAPRAETAAAGPRESRPPPLIPRAPTCACASHAALMRARRPATAVRGHLQPRPASATAAPRLAAPRPCRCQARPPSPRAPARHARPPSLASIAPLRPPRAAAPCFGAVLARPRHRSLLAALPSASPLPVPHRLLRTAVAALPRLLAVAALRRATRSIPAGSARDSPFGCPRPAPVNPAPAKTPGPMTAGAQSENVL